MCDVAAGQRVGGLAGQELAYVLAAVLVVVVVVVVPQAVTAVGCVTAIRLLA